MPSDELKQRILEYAQGRTTGFTPKGAARALPADHRAVLEAFATLLAAGLICKTGKRRDHSDCYLLTQ